MLGKGEPDCRAPRLRPVTAGRVALSRSQHARTLPGTLSIRTCQRRKGVFQRYASPAGSGYDRRCLKKSNSYRRPGFAFQSATR
jgi:hypothetical protein